MVLLARVSQQEYSVQIEGHLATFPFRELIEMVAYSSVLGMLEVTSPELVARLYFRDGQPTHASAGELRGIAAVGRVFELQDGEFHFFAGVSPTEETIWLDTFEVISRGEQMAREWKPLRAHVTSLMQVPVLKSGVDVANVQIADDIWPLLTHVDGQRTIMQIAEERGLEPYDLCVRLITLKQRGMIDFLTGNMVAPEAPHTLSAPSATAPKRGFFERLIERTLEEEARNPNSRYAPPEKRYVESD
jgi:hypothetical protein